MSGLYGASSEREGFEIRGEVAHQGRNTFLFSISKHVFDKLVAIQFMPALFLISLVILAVNRNFNPGPLFYRQKRMGKHGKPFVMWKFRTMLPDNGRKRCHTEGVEMHRITPFGAFMRRYRIDELPNLINVLRSEMSIVGPRPDTWDHAVAYCNSIPKYRERHRVRPGITGLAQVDMGYAEGMDETAQKAVFDELYIRSYGFKQEIRIIVKTFRVLYTGAGAR